LGGNRKGRARTSINKIIVFFTTGLWHGANWTFVIWGLYHGAFLLLEDYIPKLKKLPKVIGHIYALLVVCVGFVIFRADNITQAFAMISRMFCSLNFTPESISLTYQMLTPYFIVMLIAGVLFADSGTL
jgi:alginate O-acetyltransferase complex protein AlgI